MTYTPDKVTRLVRDALQSLDADGITPNVSIAKDPWNVLELLMDAPRGVRLVVHWAGDEAMGDEPAAPLITQRVEVIIAYALGLRAGVDATLAENTNRPSLLRLVSLVRGRILGMVFTAPDASEGLFRYRGCTPLETPEGVPLAAYRMQFDLNTNMPDIESVEV
ncbi:hypothetical protein [Thermosphaera sp.]